MADLSSVLGQVPFLAGWKGQDQLRQQEQTGQLQQAQTLMGLLSAAQQQQQRAQAAQKEQAFRGALSALGPNPTQDQLAQVAAQHGTPDAIMRTQQGSLDRQAQREAVSATATAAREERKAALEARLADARTSREEQAALRRELAQMQIDGRREMLGVAASLRQPREPRQNPIITTDQGIFERGPEGLIPLTDPTTGRPLRSPSLTSGGNQQALALRRMYAANPEVKLADSLEPRVAPTAEYVASVGKGMGNPVSDAELVKLWLMTTHPKGDQISNMDYNQIAKLPDLAGRISNMAGNFAFGKTLDSDTRRDMWKSISSKYKSTAAMRDKAKADTIGRGRAMGIDEALIFHSAPKE